MLEAIVVGLIVAAALAYAVWALLPASVRLRFAMRLAAWTRRRGETTVLARLGTVLERAAYRGTGGCTDCGAGQATRQVSTGRRPRRD
jgi:hypothetical protein